MNKEAVRDRILEIGIVPVVRVASPREALMAVEAVRTGGIPIVEITLTVPGAVQVIRELVRSGGPDLLVGAGTVLGTEAARRCLDAGARFLVSPVLDHDTLAFALREKVLIMAGALTPTEVVGAWKAGSDFVKVFPCGAVGGAKYIKALKDPLPEIPLVPSGGVKLETAADFVAAGAAALGVGSELLSDEALKSGDLRVVTEKASKFLSIVKQAREKMAGANTATAGRIAEDK